MNQQQLAKWKADQAAEAKADAAAQDAPTQFYTGKPYDAEAGGYIFKYRTYNPEMARWTTADPSGFPDGVNNFVYAKNEANYALDNDGLLTENFTGSASFLVPNTSVQLTANDPGQFTATLNGYNVSNGGGKYTGNLTGNLAYTNGLGGTNLITYTISLPTNPFSQTGSGTENLGDGQYRNYVSVTASFLLTKVSDGVTTVSTIQSGIGTLYGPAFE